MSQVSKSAGGRALSGSKAQTGVEAGAQAFRSVIDTIGAMTAAAYERQYPDRDRGDDDPDPRDYRAFSEFIVGEFRAAVDATDSEFREGFVRCLASLFSVVADGCCPGSDWDPLKETAESFAQAAAREDDGEVAFQNVLRCEPAITDDDVAEIERTFASQEFSGIPRRVALCTASKGGEWFKVLSEDVDTAEAIASAIPALRSYSDRLKALAELVECAEMRATIALCNHKGFDPATGRLRRTDSQEAGQ